MSPGSRAPNPLALPTISSSTVKMDWRQSARYCAKRVDAFTRGGDSRAKGSRAALALTVFGSLLTLKKRMVEKQANSSEIDLIVEDESLADQLREVEKIMLVIARGSATDRITRLIKLARDAHSCKRSERGRP